MRIRLATPEDASAIAAIYNQGIEERTATFETALRSDEDIVAWFDGLHPVVVAEDDDGGVIGFARASEYSDRECYRGVFEFAVYTDFSHRRRGAGLMVLRELVTQARTAGAWKLVSRIFVDNEPSRMLVASIGFREVGVYHRHAKLDGRWRDVVIVEKFLAPVGLPASSPPPPTRSPREQVLISLRSEDAAVRGQALDSVRSMIDVYRKLDPELLARAADAFFAHKLHEAAMRARFVELFRAYASISREAARAVDEALFTRLAKLSVTHDIDAFYEATFVVKQVASAVGDPVRASELAPYRPRLVEWTKEAIDLPRRMGGRISPANLTSLLMTLAVASSEHEEQKRELVELAAMAKERHRVEPSPSVMPPPPSLTSRPPTTPPSPPEPPPPPVVEAAPPKKTRKKRAPADPDRPKKKRARAKAES